VFDTFSGEQNMAKRTAGAVENALKRFPAMPDDALIDIPTGIALSNRSRASIYRHFKDGDLTLVKVGNSTRIKVGEMRRLIRAA
jgi:hypothetical protein